MPTVVDDIITEKIPLEAKHEKPHVTVIVDQFCMRDDMSRELLGKISSNVILCIPSHCVLKDSLIEDAQKFNFNLAMSIDYLNEAQWPKLQKVIEQNSWIKGLVIWSIASSVDLAEFLQQIKDWLSFRGIWVLYVNSNNILPNPVVPVGIFMPDGFVKAGDKNIRVTEQANFVLAQAKFKNRGLLLIQPGLQHIGPLVDWLQENINNMQLDNWSK